MLRECYLRKMKSYILFVNTVLGEDGNPQSFSSLFELESDKSSAHENSYDESEVSGRLPVSIKGTCTFLIKIPVLRIASLKRLLVSYHFGDMVREVMC